MICYLLWVRETRANTWSLIAGLSTRILPAAPAMSHAAPAMSHVANFADSLMMAISNFPQLEWLRQLPPAPQAAPGSRWNRYLESTGLQKALLATLLAVLSRVAKVVPGLFLTILEKMCGPN
jgi:hypothetical protein